MIAVLDYGIGNLRSAQKALIHVGADARLVSVPEDARNADGVVLPGVGAFGACMSALRNSGFDELVLDVIDREVPFLGICVGMQMLYSSSEESPDVSGLGVFPESVRKITSGMKLPHMQWNRLKVSAPSRLLSKVDDGWFYFVHSYAAEFSDEVVATCEYEVEIPAVIQRDRVWATQFHPEKSSSTGLRLLANFVEQTR